MHPWHSMRIAMNTEPSLFRHINWIFIILFCVQQFLKEILNELCVYNKRGTNQGTYELKPEYKKAVDNNGGE